MELRIVAPGRNIIRERVRREHDTAELARDLEMRAKALLHEIDAQVGLPSQLCHYCANPHLYAAAPPGPCPICGPAHNGAVSHRSASQYPTRSEVARSPVEIRPSTILRIR